jgi:hypothetical protein
VISLLSGPAWYVSGDASRGAEGGEGVEGGGIYRERGALDECHDEISYLANEHTCLLFPERTTRNVAFTPLPSPPPHRIHPCWIDGESRASVVGRIPAMPEP